MAALQTTTALIPCPLPADDNNIIYDCSNPYPICSNPSGFQFSSLFTILNKISQCPSDTRLFDPTAPSLTQDACSQLVRPNRLGFTMYPAADIWSRLTTWKFPLLQLVAAFPRAPLSQQAQWFTTLHVLGNPISTIRSLLLKFASCQDRADHWRGLFEGRLSSLLQMDPQYNNRDLAWKQLAIIVDSCDEWGREHGNTVNDFIQERLCNDDVCSADKIKFMHICRTTANALAADRATKFLPIAVAQVFFIGTVALAFGRTASASSGPNPATYINVEAHSVAFSALYFWVIPAVILGSVLGVSQSEGAIPRIMLRFQAGIMAEFPKWQELPLTLISGGPNGRINTPTRERNGGIYSWQPKAVRVKITDKIRLQPSNEAPQTFPGRRQFFSKSTLLFCWDYCTILKPGSLIFTLIIVLICLATAFVISANVPPIGFNCRNIGQLCLFLPWIAASFLDYLHVDEFTNGRFQLIFWLDVTSALLTMGGIVITQIGIFNRCSCYTWAIGVTTGVELPEIIAVNGTLTRRISTFYPGIAFACIAFELVVVPFIVFRQYHDAVRVFIQRDDNKSNLEWWYNIWEAIKSTFSQLAHWFRRPRNLSVGGRGGQHRRSGLERTTESRQELFHRVSTQEDVPFHDMQVQNSNTDESQRPSLARIRKSQEDSLLQVPTHDTVSSMRSGSSNYSDDDDIGGYYYASYASQ